LQHSDARIQLFEREIDGWRMRRKDSSERKSYDEVFNQQNLMRIYKLFSDGVIDRFDFPISTGKEGNVFRASTTKGELLAVKIYRTATSTFGEMAKYIHGDPRYFRVRTKSKHRLVLIWAEKEYLNLRLFERAGVRVPKPVAHHANIIVMEYIGTESEPARQLRNVELEDPERVARQLLEYIKLAYQKSGVVHSDLSEFNVLMLDNEPVVIDVGQAVLTGHPHSEEWLERDVSNVARYFRRYGLKIDVKSELKELRGR
jgi:RIO kinase 1